ncbi:sap18 [Anaeramoeba flamelloides]|uniref:Sap18 n=1 Tax=Anaeramoeba flamelloides TaxID=1746091 RepID=A0ABQ8YVM0_9EUKA|nr:sap18 [Anaeramoeba flamelloides]
MSNQNNNWRNFERKREQSYSESYYPKRRYNNYEGNRPEGRRERGNYYERDNRYNRERNRFGSRGRGQGRRGPFRNRYSGGQGYPKYLRSKRFRPIKKLTIDREKTVPFLLQIFLSLDKHNSSSFYEDVDSHKGAQVHTWLDCTLGDLTDYLKTVSKHAKKKNTKLDFNLVFKDRRTGDVRFKKAGYTYSTSSDSLYHEKTLSELNFSIGDWIDVAFIDHN